MERLKNFLESVFSFFFFGDRLKNFCEDLFFFFGEHLRFVSLVLGVGLEHSCPWPRECLSSERLSLALALASDFFCVLGLGLGLEPCVLDSTSATYFSKCDRSNKPSDLQQLKKVFCKCKCNLKALWLYQWEIS